MSCCDREYHKALPCPNCGQKDTGNYTGARMGSSDWGHDFMCCSDKCGKEYGIKLISSKKPAMIYKLQKEIEKLTNELRRGNL